MSPADLEHAGERFWRADESGSVLGTGLGLSIAKEIVFFNKGWFDIQSKPGAGTTVIMIFPLMSERDAKNHASDAESVSYGDAGLLLPD